MSKIKDTNIRVAITIPKDKVWEFKEKAVKSKMTLSEFATKALSEANPYAINFGKGIKSDPKLIK